MNLRARIDTVRDAVRTQLWPVPLMGILLGLALGVAVPEFDARYDAELSSALSSHLFGGGPSAARTLLGAVVGSLITVTSLTFSLTVVTLQLASSQFSPRLLRTFSRDRFVHGTLALFLGTFTYALAVLRTVRDAADDQPAFVPQLAVSVAFALCLASVVGLVVFLAHLARQIRVETMLVQVHRDASATLQRVLPALETGTRDPGPDPPPGAPLLPAPSSGFLVALDHPALLRAAVESDAVLLLDRSPGSSLIVGAPIGVAWSREGTLGDERLQALQEATAAAIGTGAERTADQDVGYGLRQLTDVCVKALSPGINDPTTAIHALGHTSALLAELAGRDLGPQLLRDEDGELRVVLRRAGFAELLEAALGPPRRYGASDPFVLARILELLRELAWVSRSPASRACIAEQLTRVRDTFAAQDFDEAERSRLHALARFVEEARDGRWPVAEGGFD